MTKQSSEPKLPTQILRKGGLDAAGICLRCGKHVAVAKAAILEQDGRIAEWHDFGMPGDVSQGPALFGDVCANRMRTRARFNLQNAMGEVQSQEVHLTKMSKLITDQLSRTNISASTRAFYDFLLKVVHHQQAENLPQQ